MISLKIISYAITACAILAISISAYVLYFVVDDIWIRIAGTAGLIILTIIWLFLEYHIRIKKRRVRTVEDAPVRRFVLMSEGGAREKEWHCEGMTSFLIGKGTVSRNVDIELGDTHYAEYIANEHAVLNRIDGIWYMEDLGTSINGAGIRKRGEEYALRLRPNVSYKVDEGDVLYISKVKILVR